MKTSRSPRAFRTVTLGILLAAGGALAGADWPMWGRDKTRNAVSPEKDAPVRWQIPTSNRQAENIKWSAQLGSRSWGNPVVAGGLVWVGTNNSRPRDPAVKEDAGILMCFRESDGKLLYQYVAPRLPDRHNDWPTQSLCSSPLVEGDRLWFCSNRCEAICLDIGPLRRGEGKPRVVWKVDMIQEFGVYPRSEMIGTSASHCSIGASYKGLIYVNTTNGVDGARTVPAPEAPSLVCFEKDTGKVVWKDNSPGKDILLVQHGSPLVVEVNGRGQVIAAQGDGWVRSFDPLTGKLLWKFDMNAKSARWDSGRGPRNHVLATPVLYEDRVYLASGKCAEFGYELPGRLCCIDPTRQGDISAELDDGPGKGKPNPNSGLVWSFEQRGDKPEDRMHCTVSTVAIHAGLVIAPDATGYVHCLDAQTGKKYWTYHAAAALYGSPLLVDGKVYFTSDDGDVVILALSKEKKLLAKHATDMGMYSTPVFANGVLYILTDSTLYAIR